MGFVLAQEALSGHVAGSSLRACFQHASQPAA
jgi:hypothetical protein